MDPDSGAVNFEKAIRGEHKPWVWDWRTSLWVVELWIHEKWIEAGNWSSAPAPYVCLVGLKRRPRPEPSHLMLSHWQQKVHARLLDVSVGQSLSVHLSIYTFIHLSIYPSIHLSIYPSIHLSICPFIHLSVVPSIHSLARHPRDAAGLPLRHHGGLFQTQIIWAALLV